MNVEGSIRQPSITLVWIDSAEAVIHRWHAGRVQRTHVESHVPIHRRSTGHIRHDPTIRHGGGGSQTAGEPHRNESLRRFIADVASQLAPNDDLLVTGPGTVRERLARWVAGLDRRHGRRRSIACEASAQPTDRQLVARLRTFAGAEPRRRSVGSHGWSRRSGHDAPVKPKRSRRGILANAVSRLGAGHTSL
jgi:hypothetical protein